MQVDAWQLLHPLLWTSRVLGVWPACLGKDKKDVPRVPRTRTPTVILALLYSGAISTVIISACASVAFMQPATRFARSRLDDNRLSKGGASFELGVVVQLSCWAMSFIAFLGGGVRGVSGAANFIDDLDALPLRLQWQLARPVFGRVRVQLLGCLVLPALGCGLTAAPALRAARAEPCWTCWVVVVFYSMAHTMASLLDAQFTMMVYVLRLYMATLNEQLRKRCAMTATPRVPQEARVGDLHLQIVDLARQLNGAYGLPILATLVSACVQLPTLSVTMMDWAYEGEFVLLAGSFVLASCFLLRIVLVIAACEATYAEEVLAFRYASSAMNGVGGGGGGGGGLPCEELMELQGLLLQLGHYRTRFTACGVFRINYSCLSTIASLAILIIFLVKLAQGEMSEEYTEMDHIDIFK